MLHRAAARDRAPGFSPVAGWRAMASIRRDAGIEAIVAASWYG
jgi:hypothetical protein